MSQDEIKSGESRAYWTHGVKAFPELSAQFRMAQLIDFDARLYENARIVYRFLVGWYHNDHGDALLSQRHVAKVMKQRAPEGAVTLSNRTVGRAIIALMDAGWVARTFKGRGKGKGASRYVPVINVLDLAEQGKFPEPGHFNGPVEPGHSNGPLVGHSNGPVDSEPGHPSGPKTRLPDPSTKTRVQVVMDAAPVAGGPEAAAPDGFERLAAAYDKPDDDLRKARLAFRAINPDGAELERMLLAAASWKRTANGKRMSLERWLTEKRWLSGQPLNDNRKKHRYPSCVVTRIKPAKAGAQVWFRDRDGTAQTRVLDREELADLAQYSHDAGRLSRPSEDLHEFIGARFQLWEDGTIADPDVYEEEAA